MKTFFIAEATNTGGRNGKVESKDGKLNLAVAMPESMGGLSSEATNPEQLFAAGYSSCLNGALEQVLQKARVSHGETRVTVYVSLLEDPDDQGFMLGVRIQVSIDGLGNDEAHKYAEMAHAFCPYSKAIKGNVDVELEIV